MEAQFLSTSAHINARRCMWAHINASRRMWAHFGARRRTSVHVDARRHVGARRRPRGFRRLLGGFRKLPGGFRRLPKASEGFRRLPKATRRLQKPPTSSHDTQKFETQVCISGGVSPKVSFPITDPRNPIFFFREGKPHNFETQFFCRNLPPKGNQFFCRQNVETQSCNTGGVDPQPSILNY